MKTFATAALSILLLSAAHPLPVQASCQLPVLNAPGHIEETVHYEIYGTSYVQLTANSVFVTRQVTYEGFVIPSSEVSWQEKIKDITYSGTLRLKIHTFNPKTQKTTATYEGTLTAK